MATYLITGGLGFIGSHLADALIGRGDRVRILDDLSTGRHDNAPAGAEVTIGDVADGETVARAMAGADGCFHLAAVASVEKANAEWLACHRTNMGGTVAVLEAARTAGPGGKPLPVVFASSAAVYGDNPAMPLAERAATVPLSAYGADKLGSEMHARIAMTVHGVPTTCLRFFNVFGPRQDPLSPYSGVIAIFVQRLRAGRAIRIFGDGEQYRDFIYVADVVRYLLAAMAREARRPEVFNVCTGRKTTIRELAAIIGRICGHAPELTFGPPRDGDIRESLGDPSRAQEALGLAATTSVGEGLEHTLAWIADNE